jgi:hypothetical protein
MKQVTAATVIGRVESALSEGEQDKEPPELEL